MRLLKNEELLLLPSPSGEDFFVSKRPATERSAVFQGTGGSATNKQIRKCITFALLATFLPCYPFKGSFRHPFSGHEKKFFRKSEKVTQNPGKLPLKSKGKNKRLDICPNLNGGNSHDVRICERNQRRDGAGKRKQTNSLCT